MTYLQSGYSRCHFGYGWSLMERYAALADLPVVFARMRELKLGIILATNNASKTIDEYHTNYNKFGVQLEPWQVICSSQQ